MAHHLRCSRATALPGSHLTPRGEVAGRDVPAFFEWLFCAIEHRGWVQRCTLAFCHRANRVMRQWVSDDVAVIVSTYPLARPGTGPAQGDRPDPATRCHLPHRPRRPPTIGAPVWLAVAEQPDPVGQAQLIDLTLQILAAGALAHDGDPDLRRRR
jgi:hypothetical protein